MQGPGIHELKTSSREPTCRCTHGGPASWLVWGLEARYPWLPVKAQGIDDSWQALRETLATQCRVTATLQRRDGRAMHVRKATRPEPRHQKINEMLGLSPNPGGTHRGLV